MAVRKRTWTSGGKSHTAWVVDYKDGQGKRRLKTFASKKEADAWAPETAVAVRKGTHVADSASVTVSKAADDWIARAEADNREISTVRQYRQHANLHIKPRLGATKLTQLTSPMVEDFRDELLRDLSKPLARKVLVSLKSIINEAMRRGRVGQNVALAVKIRDVKRHQKRVEPPTKAEVQTMIAKAGDNKALIVTIALAGLRASELRGLRWQDVDLDGQTIHIRQRADCQGVMGSPKSEESQRDIPVGQVVVNALKAWRLAYPRPIVGRNEKGKPIRESRRPEHLVFPTGKGTVMQYAGLRRYIYDPIMEAAGLSATTYPPHHLRHFYASWLIELGNSPKVVQSRLGHATIQLTLDLYGHLWKDSDREEINKAEMALVG